MQRTRQPDDEDFYSRRVLLMDRIQWRDGWPHVGTPSDTPQPSPAV